MSTKEIAVAQKKAMSPADVKEDMMLVLGPHMNWQEMLNPAPLSVCLLGQLVLVTLDKDVSLISEEKGRAAFKYVKYPDSLRTSMVHVANQGWTAFNTANKNMDQIRLLTLQVPEHVKNAVKFIIGGSEMEIEEIVPDILQNIARISDTCTRKAEEVEKQFTDVMELIGELQEACTLAKGTYEEKLRMAEATQVEKQKRKEAAEAKRKRVEQEYKDMKAQLEKARSGYEKALNSMPSGWETIGMDIVEGLGKAVTGSVGKVVSAVTFKSLRESYRASKEQKAKTAAGMAAEDILIEEIDKLGASVEQLLEFYYAFVNGKQIDGLLITQTEAIFSGSVEALKKYHGMAKSRTTDIGKEGAELIRLLKQYTKQMGTGDNDRKKLQEVANKLKMDMDGLQTFCRNATGGAPMDNPTPKMASVDQNANTSASASHREQCKFKVEQASAALEAARADFKATSERIETASDTVAELIGELASLDLQKVDFEKIKELLQRGIKALGEVKTQWGKLVRFFQTMSNIIKCCMEENVKNFVQSAEKGKKFRSLKYGISDILRDTIYTQASEANKIAFMVNNLSTMYVEVSEKHLMDQVACLGELVALDPVNDRHEIAIRQESLRIQAQEATASIADIVRQKQIEFDTKIKKRIEKIETEMRSVLPPPTAEDRQLQEERKKAIKEAQDYKEATQEQNVDDWV